MILFNGRSGSLGQYLAETLARRRVPSYAISARLEDDAGLSRELEALPVVEGATFVHLAARVSVPACEADPEGAYRTNVALAKATVETVLEWGSKRAIPIRIIYVSTGHVYAASPVGSRLSENDPTRPRSVYAKTKLAAEGAIGAVAGPGAEVVIARVFGLIAPRQPDHYVLPALVGRVLTGRLEGIPGLDFVRDYLDARDVCEDLALLSSSALPSGPLIVNVCSGVPVSIRDVLHAVLATADPARADKLADAATAAPGRADDVPWLVGDPSRFEAVTGVPARQIDLATTARDAIAIARGTTTVGSGGPTSG